MTNRKLPWNGREKSHTMQLKIKTRPQSSLVFLIIKKGIHIKNQKIMDILFLKNINTYHLSLKWQKIRNQASTQTETSRFIKVGYFTSDNQSSLRV